jgi:hypothetical protein
MSPQTPQQNQAFQAKAQKNAQNCFGLETVIACWPSLPKHIRKAILLLVTQTE